MQEFEELVPQIPNLFGVQLLDYFLNGFKIVVRLRVRSVHTTNVLRAIEIVRDVDEELRLAQGPPLAHDVCYPSRHTEGGMLAGIPVEEEENEPKEIKLKVKCCNRDNFSCAKQ